MPIKPPIVTEMDLIRGRQIVSSLAPLKRLSCDDAQIVARAIAESFAEGRRPGLDIAKAELQA
jgi:hypothetical protein